MKRLSKTLSATKSVLIMTIARTCSDSLIKLFEGSVPYSLKYVSFETLNAIHDRLTTAQHESASRFHDVTTSMGVLPTNRNPTRCLRPDIPKQDQPMLQCSATTKKPTRHHHNAGSCQNPTKQQQKDGFHVDARRCIRTSCCRIQWSSGVGCQSLTFECQPW